MNKCCRKEIIESGDTVAIKEHGELITDNISNSRGRRFSVKRLGKGKISGVFCDYAECYHPDYIWAMAIDDLTLVSKHCRNKCECKDCKENA